MRKSIATHDLVTSAVMLAVLVALGFLPAIPLGVIPVPILLQNMGIMLAGALLGPRLGTMTVALFLLLVALGLPVLSGGRGGIVMFVGPTAGYLWGYLLVPVAIWLLRRISGAAGAHWWGEFLIITLAGALLVDLTGTLWLTFAAHMCFDAALIANLTFIPGDIIKAGITTVITRRLRRIGR